MMMMMTTMKMMMTMMMMIRVLKKEVWLMTFLIPSPHTLALLMSSLVQTAGRKVTALTVVVSIGKKQDEKLREELLYACICHSYR